jgi:hypothetical protein
MQRNSYEVLSTIAKAAAEGGLLSDGVVDVAGTKKPA